jgi:PKD repeat protein
VVAVLGACGAFATQAPAAVVHQANGHFLGVAPRRGVNPASIPGSVAATRAASGLAQGGNGNLDYHNGPVVHSSAPYLIFWTPSGESLPSGTAALMERYFTDTAADSGDATNVFAVDRQYTDGTGFAGYRQTFSTSQAFVDSDAYPARESAQCKDTGEPTCLTDAQLQAEVTRFIGENGLPSDGPANASELPSGAPIYFVVLPPDVNVCFGAGQPDVCSDNYFCAYHSNFTETNGDAVLYAAIPTVLAVSDPKSCQYDGNSAVQEPNASAGDVVLSYTSHETSETITDPFGTAWYNNLSGNEGSDNCAFYGPLDPADGTNPDAFAPTLGGSAGTGNPDPPGTLFDQLINGDQYYTQSAWSNGDANCELQPSAGNVDPAFSVQAEAGGPNAVGAPITFDPVQSTSTNPLSSATWNFGDGTTAFSAGPLTSQNHTYGSPGTYTVTLTLVDSRGNLATSSQVVRVYGDPSASIAVSPNPVEGAAVSFDGSGSSDPDSGVTLSSYSWSFGDGTGGTGETTEHTFAAAGTYTVTLTVTNSLGLKSSTSVQVTVADELPAAAFTIGAGTHTTDQPVTFSAGGSVDPDGSVVTYVWEFGDGVSASGVTTSHTYRSAGTYTVTLTIVDSSGKTAATSQQVTVLRAGRITKISFVTKNHRRFLVVAVDGPGWLSVGRRTYALGKARTAKVRIRLTASEYRALLDRRRLTLRIPVAFAPMLGAHISRTATLRLRS